MKTSTKAKRSLAASKANWTRAIRKAYPEGGPIVLPELSTAELQLELLRRALDRSRLALAAHRVALDNLQAKHDARVREYAVQTERYLTVKGLCT